MDLFSNLALGFSAVFTPEALLFCFVGVMTGTLIGVLPGIGPLATIALLIPFTYGLEPVSALVMLAGIYYGAQYGGSTTAILMRMPGESSSVVTALDGYEMAKQGRAGPALAIAAIGSFIAGCFATAVVAIAGPAIAEFSLYFSSQEYFSLMVLGLVAAVAMAHGSVLKALAMTVVGLILGLVGTDVSSGTVRYAFGSMELFDGLDFVPLAMGLFGLSEIISNLSQPQDRHVLTTRIGSLLPTADDMRRSLPAIGRGTVLGSVLGILPGGGAVLSSFASYFVEKRISREPERFGKGAIEGVAGPESANNAGAQTSFIPLLTLGLPSNAIMALLMGAMIVQGIVPGPAVVRDYPELFWGIIVSMWIGNLMLLVINLPMLGIWVSLLRVPYRILFPAIVLFCCMGVYSVSYSTFDVLMAAMFAAAGFLFLRLGCEIAPLLLGFILGPLMEENLRRSMLLSRGDAMTFIDRPISAALLVLTLLVLVILIFPKVRSTRTEAFKE